MQNGHWQCVINISTQYDVQYAQLKDIIHALERSPQVLMPVYPHSSSGSKQVKAVTQHVQSWVKAHDEHNKFLVRAFL